VSWNGADFAGARLWDLRDEYLGDETFIVELGRYEGPHINIATKDDSHVRLSHWIGNNPEVGHPTQQRRAANPNCGNEDDE
jgi:hypothetical protein